MNHGVQADLYVRYRQSAEAACYIFTNARHSAFECLTLCAVVSRFVNSLKVCPFSKNEPDLAAFCKIVFSFKM